MTKHYKTYIEHFGYLPGDRIKCELSGFESTNNEIHHLKCKGMGGNPSGDKEHIGNYMCLRTDLHLLYGDKKKYMDFLKKAHKLFLEDGFPWVERGNKLPDFSEKPIMDCRNYW